MIKCKRITDLINHNTVIYFKTSGKAVHRASIQKSYNMIIKRFFLSAVFLIEMPIYKKATRHKLIYAPMRKLEIDVAI